MSRRRRRFQEFFSKHTYVGMSGWDRSEAQTNSTPINFDGAIVALVARRR